MSSEIINEVNIEGALSFTARPQAGDGELDIPVYHGVFGSGSNRRPVAIEWDSSTGEPISILDSSSVRATSTPAPQSVKIYMRAIGGNAF